MKPQREERRKRRVVTCALLAMVFAILVQSALAWRHKHFSYTESFTYTCPHDSHLYFLQSERSDSHNDRRWEFDCDPLYVSTYSCTWTGWISSYRDRSEYRCGPNGYMTGIQMEFSSTYWDRRFKHRCCYTHEATIGSSCAVTPYLPTQICNDPELIRFETPRDYVLQGFYSYFRSQSFDRMFKFRYCRFVRK